MDCAVLQDLSKPLLKGWWTAANWPRQVLQGSRLQVNRLHAAYDFSSKMHLTHPGSVSMTDEMGPATVSA